MKVKSKLYWASIGGAKSEPIRVLENKWYSLGCGDPHELTEAIELIEEITDIPLNKKDTDKQERLWYKEQRRLANLPGYRKFD